MSLEFSLAHLTLLDSSPIEMIEIAHRTGYDFVSLRLTPVCKDEEVFPLVTDSALRLEVKNRLADTGRRLLDIELARLGPTDEPENFLTAMEAGADLGAHHLLCQLPDPDRARATDRFARLCELARPFGLTVDLEFPSWSETCNVSDAASIIRQTGNDNAGILVDTLHFARSESTLTQLRNLPQEWFHFVQLCDADKAIPDTTEGLIHTARSDRRLIGDGGINVREIVDAMPQVPYSLEIPNDRLKQALGNEEYARRAIQAARHCLSQNNIHRTG